jgi:hypothetical protein
VGDHGATRLRKLVAVARKHRDKAEAQVRRLDSRARGERMSPDGRRVSGALRTRLKVDVFADILARFERALDRADARPDPEAPRARPAVRRAKRAAKRVASAAAVQKSEAKAKKKRGRTAAVKAAKRVSKTRAVSAKAHAKTSPQGTARQRKDQVTSQRTYVAHAKSSQRRQQAKRDGR